jgi:hypothetical protein
MTKLHPIQDRRVPHPCAFCAQGWDFRVVSRVEFVLHVILGGAALQRGGTFSFSAPAGF